MCYGYLIQLQEEHWKSSALCRRKAIQKGLLGLENVQVPREQQVQGRVHFMYVREVIGLQYSHLLEKPAWFGRVTAVMIPRAVLYQQRKHDIAWVEGTNQTNQR